MQAISADFAERRLLLPPALVLVLLQLLQICSGRSEGEALESSSREEAAAREAPPSLRCLWPLSATLTGPTPWLGKGLWDPLGRGFQERPLTLAGTAEAIFMPSLETPLAGESQGHLAGLRDHPGGHPGPECRSCLKCLSGPLFLPQGSCSTAATPKAFDPGENILPVISTLSQRGGQGQGIPLIMGRSSPARSSCHDGRWQRRGVLPERQGAA